MNTEHRPNRRIALLASGVVLVALAVAARLVYLQAIDSEVYRTRAREQHEGQVKVEGMRGTIWDRNGRELAVSVATKSAFVRPVAITSAGVKERLIAGVATALGQPPSDIRTLLDGARGKKFLYLKRRMTPRETRALEDLHLPQIGFLDDTRRFYPREALAAHVLGFVDVDGKGQAGIERAFDDEVRGEPTTFISLIDARQRPLLLRTDTSGRSGSDLVLTIDEYIQHLADSELDTAMDETGAKGGAIIVMNPGTGEILALANRPGFDPNRAGAASPRDRENFAVSYGYEPGSTFKVITASMAIEENRARPSDLFDCGMGSITLFGRRIGDHNPYGTLSLAQIIAKSSNVGIIRVGQRLSSETFCAYVDRFGFGKRTGIELPSESPGVVQVPGGRTWSGLSQPMMSMGQSIVVTPLQMLTAVATIAAGGMRPSPRIVRSITGTNGALDRPRPAPVRVLSAQTAETLARMMEVVVEDGTGKSAAIPGYRVAGKTGTAQKVVDHVYSHTAHVASFAGFAPSTHPSLSAIVVLDEPIGKYYGGDVAAPAFARVVGQALAYLRVPPTEEVGGPRVPGGTLRARADSAPHRRAIVLKAAMQESRENEPDIRPFPAPWPASVRVQQGIVPDLYGFGIRAATTALAKSGCRTRVSGSGFVVELNPPAGTPISVGGSEETCSIVLGNAPPARGAAQEGS